MLESIFDMHAIKRYRQRAIHANTPGADFLLVRAAQEMADRLAFIDRKFNNAAITSGNGGFLTHNFLTTTRHNETLFNSILAQNKQWTHFNEEQLPSNFQDLDLALSFLSLHETNDTPGALVQIRQALKPDGLFMGVLPASGTLHELRQCLIEAETEICGGARPRIYPFMDVRAAGSLLQRAGFALPVADSETITVRYADMFALMRDLRGMGQTNGLVTRSKQLTPRAVFFRAANIYQEKFGQEDGKIPATFSFIWISGWAPHASQQKPAKRGSATVSLTQILK